MLLLSDTASIVLARGVDCVIRFMTCRRLLLPKKFCTNCCEGGEGLQVPWILLAKPCLDLSINTAMSSAVFIGLGVAVYACSAWIISSSMCHKKPCFCWTTWSPTWTSWHIAGQCSAGLLSCLSYRTSC